MSMIAAFELDNLVAFCIGARKPQRGHRRFGPRIDEADHLDIRHELHDTFCQIEFERAGRAVGCPFDGSLLNRFHHMRMRMTRNERSPGKDIVNIAVAVHIVKIRSLTAVNKQWLSPYRTKGAYR